MGYRIPERYHECSIFLNVLKQSCGEMGEQYAERYYVGFGKTSVMRYYQLIFGRTTQRGIK